MFWLECFHLKEKIDSKSTNYSINHKYLLIEHIEIMSPFEKEVNRHSIVCQHCQMNQRFATFRLKTKIEQMKGETQKERRKEMRGSAKQTLRFRLAPARWSWMTTSWNHRRVFTWTPNINHTTPYINHTTHCHSLIIPLPLRQLPQTFISFLFLLFSRVCYQCGDGCVSVCCAPIEKNSWKLRDVKDNLTTWAKKIAQSIIKDWDIFTFHKNKQD